jgi:hypothetical protein
MTGPDKLVGKVQKWPEGMNLQPLFISLYGDISARKQRLAAVAMCRRVGRLLPDPECREALDVAERYADRKAKRADVALAHAVVQSAGRRLGGVALTQRENATRYAVQAVASLTHPTKCHFADEVADRCAAAVGYEEPAHYSRRHHAECVEQKRLLLDVLPPLATPAEMKRWAGHDGRLPARLALGIYEDRAYERLPILADALEEAGCTDPDVLSHLRGPGPHVRGCWALDMLLGKG